MCSYDSSVSLRAPQAEERSPRRGRFPDARKGRSSTDRRPERRVRPLRDKDSPRLGRSALIAGAVVLAAAAALTAGLLVGGSASKPGARATTWPEAPLASSFVTASGSWAILPMGHLSDPQNTFWQLFFRPAGRSDWTLVTPPGVADNGGLAASPGPDGSVAVVFAPNDLLTFSPFAITSDNGSVWTPGVIPLGTAPVPDVFTAPLTAGTQISVLERGGSAVAVGTGRESNWATLFTRSQLAGSPGASSCGVAQLTALAASGHDDLVGSNCTKPGVVGIFSSDSTVAGAGSVQLLGPKLASSEGEFSVLRLSVERSRVVALVDARKGSADALYALWEDGQPSAWSMSEAFPLQAGASVVSTGFAPGGTLVVETKSGAGDLDAAVTGGDGDKSWHKLPTLPAYTESVSVGVGGTVDALSASLSQLTDWQLSDGQWHKTQVLTVPIQYGSSS